MASQGGAPSRALVGRIRRPLRCGGGPPRQLLEDDRRATLGAGRAAMVWGATTPPRAAELAGLATPPPGTGSTLAWPVGPLLGRRWCWEVKRREGEWTGSRREDGEGYGGGMRQGKGMDSVRLACTAGLVETGSCTLGYGQQIAHACINASEAPQQHALEYSHAWVSSFCMHAGKASAACEDAYRPPC